jgi:lipopolysaccharide biosynthesis regulator YciM
LTRYGADNLYATEANRIRGQLLILSDRAQEAIPILEQVLANYRKFVGERSPNVVGAKMQLAKAHQAVGHTTEAEDALNTAKQMIEHDHAGDTRLAQQLVEVTAEVERLKSGQKLHCGA